MLTGKEKRAARCGASGKRFDADCRHDRPSLRAADWRASATLERLHDAPHRATRSSLRSAPPIDGESRVPMRYPG